ncbi:TPA: ATP-binding cassette domain-containing protein [Streptococcus pyogenes]|nr:ATP-binding cassette domain-containing protein [Streptococcus pyogenes]HEP1271836.1 ATP-binding cassette domain-containing protein [Streptococcus pyogenes]HEQ4208494.1 ATP-binding cassette domain-containing protein [Streptococcus pyogenes]HES6343218.1 ATP-binding cassette domain-containing protein [Streptococcus pyogenes]
MSYKYGFGRDTLSNISLTIKEGEKVSIVGISGSGKTTLAKMIVNFFEPYKGQISINHQNLKMIDKKVPRQHINYLPQQAHIFSGSILENLTLGANHSTSQEDILINIRNDIHILKFDTYFQTGQNIKKEKRIKRKIFHSYFIYIYFSM